MGGLRRKTAKGQGFAIIRAASGVEAGQAAGETPFAARVFTKDAVRHPEGARSIHDVRTLALLDGLETDLEAETSVIEASSRRAEDNGLTEPKFEAKPQPSRFVLERRQAVWPVATPAGPHHRHRIGLR